VFLVRRQVDREFTKGRPYDVQDHGLVVWSDHTFSEECFVKLDGSHVSSFHPSQLARTLGLSEVPDRRWIFAASETTWAQWEKDWEELIAEHQVPQGPTMSSANRLE
jgi:hypothetical protein